jgi:5-methylcytosine-specific restriction protein A
MIKSKSDLIRETVEKRTGATIELNEKADGVQKGLEIRFGDLTRNEGPLVTLRPSGLRRHLVSLRFGSYSASVVEQISQADAERVDLARALVRSIDDAATLSFPDATDAETWLINSPSFTLKAERKVRGNRQSDEEIVETCESVVVPIMAALAELIGYEEASPLATLEGDSELEGAVTISTVRRRERNPRNRLLCLHIHGYACVTCGIDPRKTYGANGSVIEVHHLQPLSQINEPRAYDPRTDLVPLCPTCHRVVHSRRPLPWSPAEVREMMNG